MPPSVGPAHYVDRPKTRSGAMDVALDAAGSVSVLTARATSSALETSSTVVPTWTMVAPRGAATLPSA